MDNKTRSKLVSSLMGTGSMDEKITKYFAMNFSIFSSVVNLKMVAMLNEKLSDGKEPAEDFLKTIMEAWKDAATIQISEELKIFDDMEDDVLGNIFGSLLGTKEETEKLYMKALDEFFDNIVLTLEK